MGLQEMGVGLELDICDSEQEVVGFCAHGN